MQVDIVADMPGSPRIVFYRVTDDQGNVTEYGPVFTSDPDFDAEAFKQQVLARATEAAQ